MPASPDDWRYQPPRVPSWWHRHSRTLRVLALGCVLALCGVTILALVREQTGTQGLLVGLALAVLPVPLLVAVFRWLDNIEPTPWGQHVFAFAWGACAATLIALLANSFTTAWLADPGLAGSMDRADTLGTTLVAPIVEESVKGAAVLLLYVHRRRWFTGIVSGITLAGITATGFAFTENVLYLGNAYGQDTAPGAGGPYPSATALTFFGRIVFAPFAHPLFTAMVGVGFGLAVALPHRRRVVRVLLPLGGLLAAMLLHGIWNGSASQRDHTFLVVYAAFMLPVFGLLVWLAVAARLRLLRTIRRTLPAYAAAGWISAPESWALGSLRARAVARGMARRLRGPGAVQTVLEYQHFATSLALLRARAERGAPASDFQAREQELLHHLWTRRPVAGPPTESAALSLSRPRLPHQQGWPGGPPLPPGQHPYGPWVPYGSQGSYGSPWPPAPQSGQAPKPPST